MLWKGSDSDIVIVEHCKTHYTNIQRNSEADSTSTSETALQIREAAIVFNMQHLQLTVAICVISGFVLICKYSPLE